MIYNIKGNLLDSHCQYICHQVNCQGRMNSGVAKAIREKWPIVFERYKERYDYALDMALNDKISNSTVSSYLLGTVQFVPLYESYWNDTKHQHVINMFAQNYYGYDGDLYTSYDAFWRCLKTISTTAPKGSTIAFPKNIGCCRGGANWKVISTMIEEVLGKDYVVFIYELEENKTNAQSD